MPRPNILYCILWVMNRLPVKIYLPGFIACTLLLIGCDWPVYFYALNHWKPSPYELTVFHRKELSPMEKETIESLRQYNLDIRFQDRDTNPEQGSIMVLHYPRAYRIRTPIWSGRVTKQSVNALIESPTRTEIASRLVEGDTTVWVLVCCGIHEKDDPARNLLDRHLSHLKTTLKPDPARPYRFSVIEISRSDPREIPLINMLISSESDLKDYMEEPIAFPVFGRGRVYCALVGQGITEKNINEAAGFIVNPCSCEAKDLNPGTDLFMSVDWDKELEPILVSASPDVPFASLRQSGSTQEDPSDSSSRILVLFYVVAGLIGGMAVIVSLLILRRSAKDQSP